MTTDTGRELSVATAESTRRRSSAPAAALVTAVGVVVVGAALGLALPWLSATGPSAGSLAWLGLLGLGLAAVGVGSVVLTRRVRAATAPSWSWRSWSRCCCPSRS